MLILQITGISYRIIFCTFISFTRPRTQEYGSTGNSRRNRLKDSATIATGFKPDGKGTCCQGKPQKRLERDGYITRYSAIADPRKLGNDIVALCNIRLKQHNTRDLIRQFMETVKKTERITECYNTTGDYDFQIKVYAHDMRDYQDFIVNTLGKLDCIGYLHSAIVIGEIKDSHCIPVSNEIIKK